MIIAATSEIIPPKLVPISDAIVEARVFCAVKLLLASSDTKTRRFWWCIGCFLQQHVFWLVVLCLRCLRGSSESKSDSSALQSWFTSRGSSPGYSSTLILQRFQNLTQFFCHSWRHNLKRIIFSSPQNFLEMGRRVSLGCRFTLTL